IVYFHGGGFTTGSLESYEPLAMALAEASAATLISVHYPRLPEATPRAMIAASWDALQWAAAMAGPLDADPRRIALAGDSAGAFIAAQLAIMARDRGGPALACQALCYGVFDIDESREAYRRAADQILTPPVIAAMIRAYRESDARDPLTIPPPLHQPALAGLPPTILLAAEHDPMRDEGDAFAARLHDAGVTVSSRVAPAMPHGFLRAQRFSGDARAEMDRLGQSIRTFF
ncbi:MAG TPA: alpha/beta hydrolase, partial [Sphingomonadaceae bacterium]|nr:alpha/beta hydrolase [Sphingomonadaceae bacterium]